jgi:hypothetical protein
MSVSLYVPSCLGVFHCAFVNVPLYFLHAVSFLDFGLLFLIWLPITFDACIFVGLFFVTCFGTKRGNTKRSERHVHRLVAGIDKELARKMHMLDDDGGGATVLAHLYIFLNWDVICPFWPLEYSFWELQRYRQRSLRKVHPSHLLTSGS